MVLMPATLQLFGRANWWFPKPLDRLIPNLMPESDQETWPAVTAPRPSAGGNRTGNSGTEQAGCQPPGSLA